MFNDKNSKNPDRIETLIGEQCTIVGNLTGDGVLKIDGTVKGDILWQDNIILGPTGVYSGNLTCKNAFISGKLNGNVFCEDTLTIDCQGKVFGDIATRYLVVLEGGLLDGRSTMLINKELPEVLE